MKKFQNQSRRATQLLLSVFVLLACSIQFVTFVSDAEGALSITSGYATAVTTSNTRPTGTTLITFTATATGLCSNESFTSVWGYVLPKKYGTAVQPSDFPFDVVKVPDTTEEGTTTFTAALKTKRLQAAQNTINPGTYSLKIDVGANSAHHSGKTGSCYATTSVITVTVTTPAIGFAAHDSTKSVPEDAAIGTEIIDMDAATAYLPDDIPRRIMYSLESIDANSFEIDSDGVVKTTVGLDYETKTSYSLTIRASLIIGPSVTSSDTTLTVNVTDVNEPPVFAGDITTRSVQENSAVDTDIGSPVTATDPDARDTLTYTLGGTHGDSFAIDSATGQLKTKTSSTAAGTYSVMVTASDSGALSDMISVTITVTPGPPPPEPQTEEQNNPPPPELEVVSTPPVPPAATPAPAPTPEAKPTPKKVVVYRCPVGWQRTNGVGRPTPKVFVQAIEVEIDKSNRAGIYTATAVEIYVDPTEGLTDLAGWKLKLAVPYNHGREYLLTAENAVVNEEGIVRIESPEADPFPIRDLTYVGQVLPGFDYRLFTEKGRRVDFAISCYKDTNATLEGLAAMETPRIIRSVDTTNLDWAALNFLRSKWGMPAEAVPAAPRLSSPQLRLATMWSVLKQQ